MARKPSKKELLESVARDDRGTDTNRRRILKSGAATALASAVGLGGVFGTASASDGNDGFEELRKTADRKRLQEAAPLVKELAAEGLISHASASAFPDAPLAYKESGSAVLKYGERVVHTFVIRTDGAKLTVNIPEDEEPHAIYAFDGDGPGERVRFDQIKGTIETTKMVYTQDVSTQRLPQPDCPATCGGSTCSPAGNCWWDKRRCDESCRRNAVGNWYCHDDCYCGC